MHFQYMFYWAESFNQDIKLWFVNSNLDSGSMWPTDHMVYGATALQKKYNPDDIPNEFGYSGNDWTPLGGSMGTFWPVYQP